MSALTCGELSCDECNARTAALMAERDQLRVDLELADVMYQRECEIEHELRTEVERLRSDRDCEKRLRKDADEFRENAIARAMKAEGDLVALEQCHDDNCRGVVRIADDLTAATAEVARLKRDYEYDHKCLHEVRERCESWKQRAERAEAELATAKERLRSEAMDDYAAIKDLQRELAAERGKLDWVFQNCKVEANDYSTGNRDVYYVHDREDLGVAMKEDAK